MPDAKHKRHPTLASVIDEASVRLFDVLVALLLLLALLPVAVFVAVAIKLDSRGPLFFRARRVGRNGREFDMLKFRKMTNDARGPRLTVANDDRLTRVGAFLVRFKLDEIPQLWNVMRGDMSLVGPRPEDPSLVALRRDAYADILTVSPGMSGLSQLAYAKESHILDPNDRLDDYLNRVFPQKLHLDRVYTRRRSLLLNLRILLWTAIAVAGRDVAVHRATGRLNLRRRPAQQPVREAVPSESVRALPTTQVAS